MQLLEEASIEMGPNLRHPVTPLERRRTIQCRLLLADHRWPHLQLPEVSVLTCVAN
jgi:hypothetical protein